MLGIQLAILIRKICGKYSFHSDELESLAYFNAAAEFYLVSGCISTGCT